MSCQKIRFKIDNYCLADFRHSIILRKIKLTSGNYNNNDAGVKIIKTVNCFAIIEKNNSYSSEIGGYVANDFIQDFIVRFSTEKEDILTNTTSWQILFKNDTYKIQGVNLQNKIKNYMLLRTIKQSKIDN